jgi:hypothetical protein
MLSIPQKSSIQALLDRQATQRAIRRLAYAVAQTLQLRVENPALVIAPHLGQPITLSNQEALELWVEETLNELDLPIDTEAVEPLCQHLAQILEEVS